ncbi:MAG: DNA polymerase III subunit delta [Ruminococcaceae bacterium]|nr:DNA polymerase III subunit delta [Oscillospiraceae bacterium]
MCSTLAISYKIENLNMQKLWLVLSKDDFAGQDNLKVICKIAEEYGIDQDSISYFTNTKFDLDELSDLAQTVSFFGDRLIIIKDFDISDLADNYVEELCRIIDDSEGTHFAIVLTYEDEKSLSAKKYAPLMELAQKQGVYHQIKEIDDKYLVDISIEKAKSLGTSLDKATATYIVQNVGKNIGLVLNEVEKYCAACNYTKISREDIDAIGVKTLEARIFDVIDLICNKKPVKALETLNLLYSQGTDEIAVLGALATSFIDIHRCKLAKKKGTGYQTVHQDFEKRSNAYRYQKAMNNANKFSEKGLEEIISLMLKTDISLKSSSVEKRHLIDILVTQIIVKGMAD